MKGTTRFRLSALVLALLLPVAPGAVTPAHGEEEAPPVEPYRLPLSAYAFSAEAGKSVYPRNVNAGTLRISFSDMVPERSYDIHWYESRTVSPPLDASAPLAALSDFGPSTPCQKLAALASAVWASTSEVDAARNVGLVRAFLADGECDDDEVKAKAAAAVAATLWSSVIEAEIEPGSVVEVEVRRANADGLSESVTFVFNGPEPSRFFQTYGFSYFQNENQDFYTEENAEGEFLIREAARRSSWEPAGLLLLNYRLGGPWKQGTALNLAGALSFDGEEPSVGVGVNFTFANNIGVVAGVAMAKRTRLRGEYRAGDNGSVLDAALAADQLVDEQIGATFFVGLSLNLANNPFKKDPDTSTEPAEGSK